MKNKIILHVGTPKTGTTYLQNMLNIERHKLDPYFHYHQLENFPSTCHWWFAASFFDELKQYADVRQSLKAEEEIYQKSLFSIECLKKELLIHKNVLMSAEQFFFLPEYVLYKIKELFLSLSAEVKILLYIRKPISLIESRVSQRVKSGLGSIEQTINEVNPFQLKINIEKFEKVFGRDSLQIQHYDKIVKLGINGFLTDVESLLETTISADTRLSIVGSGLTNRDQNRALSAEALFALNELSSAFAHLKPSDTRRLDLIRELESVKGNKYILPPLQAQKILDTHSDIQWIEDRYNLSIDQSSVPERNELCLDSEVLLKALKIIASYIDT